MGHRQQQDRDRPRYYETPQPKGTEMTVRDEIPDVRLVTGAGGSRFGTGFPIPQSPPRTAAQKHTDEAFDHATDSADRAINGFADSLEWATSIGVEIPSRIKGVVTILGQWQKHLEDERKRRG